MFKLDVELKSYQSPALADLKTLLAAYKAKNDYKKSLDAYNKRPALARLLERRPSEPIPSVGSERIELELQKSLKGYFPSLRTFFKEGNIKGSTVPSFSLKDGKLFIDLKSSFSEPAEDLSRPYSVSYRYDAGIGLRVVSVTGRDLVNSEFFNTKVYHDMFSGLDSSSLANFKDLDSVLRLFYNDTLAVPEDSEVKGAIKRMVDIANVNSSTDSLLRSEVGFKRGNMSIRSLRDYAELYFDAKQARSSFPVVRMDDRYGVFMFKCADSAEERLSDFSLLSSVALFEYANENVFSKRPELSLLMERAQRMYPGEENLGKMLEEFLTMGRQSGYSMDELRKRVDLMFPFSEPFRPSYTLIEKKVADNYVRYVNEQLETAWGEGVRDVSKVEILSPYGQMERSFSQAFDKQKEEASVEVTTSSVENGKGNGIASTVVETDSKLLPSGTIYTIFPEDLTKNVVPPGIGIKATCNGTKYIESTYENKLVPEEGLILIKNSNSANKYVALSMKQFELLYTVGEDGLARRREIKQNLKPGLRKRNTLKTP